MDRIVRVMRTTKLSTIVNALRRCWIRVGLNMVGSGLWSVVCSVALVNTQGGIWQPKPCITGGKLALPANAGVCPRESGKLRPAGDIDDMVTGVDVLLDFLEPCAAVEDDKGVAAENG